MSHVCRQSVPTQPCPPRPAKRHGRPLPIGPFPQCSLVPLSQAVTWVVVTVQGRVGNTGGRGSWPPCSKGLLSTRLTAAREGVGKWEGAALPRAEHDGAPGWPGPARPGPSRESLPSRASPGTAGRSGGPGHPTPGISGCLASQGTGRACCVCVACACARFRGLGRPVTFHTQCLERVPKSTDSGLMLPCLAGPRRAKGRLTMPGQVCLGQGAADAPARWGQSR